MDFEDIEYSIKAPELASSPRNEEHFTAALPEQIEEIESQLPLNDWCEAGSYERGSLDLNPKDVLISECSGEEIRGHAVVTFEEYDRSHFTDGTRRLRLDFTFEWNTQLFRFRCSKAAKE